MSGGGEAQGPDGSIHIDGYPDAVRMIELTGPNALRFSHLGLHRSDLAFSKSSFLIH